MIGARQEDSDVHKTELRTMPKVSIIMGVYNGAKYLRDAMESIINQTFNDFEFIIINDHSTDNSSDIINEYLNKDDRIKFINNDQNIGLTKSLNKGIRHAQGEYIARMDSDDVAFKDRFKKQVDFMDNHPDVVLLGTGFHEINESGRELNRKRFPTLDREIRNVLIKYNPFCHASVLIRKSALESAGLYDETVLRTQDYDLWFKLVNIGKVANLPDFLMKRRYSSENISIARENEQLKWAIKIRINAIKSTHYSCINYLYLIRPIIALITPFFIKKAIRKHFLKNKMCN